MSAIVTVVIVMALLSGVIVGLMTGSKLAIQEVRELLERLVRSGEVDPGSRHAIEERLK